MMPPRQATCGMLALLMAGLPIWVLDGARPSGPRRTVATTEASVITAYLVSAAAPMTRLDAAQPPAVNSGRPSDQTSRSAIVAPAASIVLGTGSDVADDEAYLPVSQLTEWPRARGLAAPWDEEDDSAGDTSPSAYWRSPTAVEAVLMIDEQGEVRRVQFNDNALALSVRQWLERRLRATRFVPGRLFGRPVGSRLSIELVLY